MHAPESIAELIMAVGGVILIAAGATALLALRRDPDCLRVSLARVGRISTITCTIAGLAAVGIGYHLFVYALDIPHFRAPLWIAGVVAAIAVVGSLVVDGAENSLAERDNSPEE